jgi:YfiR/HmsC-like
MLAWAGVCLGLAVSTLAQPSNAPEYNLKASYLVAFTRYTVWPTNVIPNGQTPIVIGVLGRNPFGGVLTNTVAQEIQGRNPLVVRTVSTPAEAAACQLVFVSRAEAGHEAEWLERLRDKPILTVGESPGSLENGAVLQFVIVGDGHVRFNADWQTIQRSGLKISAEMLRSARTVAHAPATSP